MKTFKRSHLVGAGLAGVVLAVAMAFGWLCLRDSRIAFLPAHSGAEWILYPRQLFTGVQPTFPRSAAFETTVVLETLPKRARLSFRAFRTASLSLNGQILALPEPRSANWKSAVTLDVQEELHAGTNLLRVVVTNTIGPPALWLRLQVDDRQFGTDKSWRAALAGGDWLAACPAGALAEGAGPNDSVWGSERMPDSVKRVWPTVACFAALSLLLAWCACRLSWLVSPSPQLKRWGPWLLLLAVILVRAALFVHNVPLVTNHVGFDTDHHQDYVQYLLKNHKLPLPNEGVEMYHPPLFYMLGASVLKASGHPALDEEGLMWLRGVNGVVGLVHCWVLFLCLRLIFPDNFRAQAAGLLLGAFLPPHLYLSQYVTNEPLSGLLVTAALYCCLRAMRDDRPGWWGGVGVALGLALLTKISVVLAIPILLGTWALQQLGRPKGAAGRCILSLLAVLFPVALAGGWYYGRVWLQTGRLPFGNWSGAGRLAWWQDPGFQTTEYYFRFGQALVRPLFSGFCSFGDGVYSTLWGDGLVSGVARLTQRPPWNYDLINMAGILGVGLSLLFLLGGGVALVRLVRWAEGKYFLLLGLPAIFGLGLLYMTLSMPSYAMPKAFYCLSAILPFSILVIMGGIWLGRRHWLWQLGLESLVLTWTLTTVTGFWIIPNNPQVMLSQCLGQIHAGMTDAQAGVEVQRQFVRVLELDERAVRSGRTGLVPSGRAEVKSILGMLLERWGATAQAMEYYRQAVDEEPELSPLVDNYALVLATTADERFRDSAKAIFLAQRACSLTHNLTPRSIGTLAAAYVAAGHMEEAAATAQRAVACAVECQDAAGVVRNRQILEYATRAANGKRAGTNSLAAPSESKASGPGRR